MVNQVEIMKQLKDLTLILYDFYKKIWEIWKEASEVDYKAVYSEFNEKFVSNTLSIIEGLPHEISERVYYDVLTGLMEIRFALELVFLAQFYGKKTEVPDAIKINLDEALEMPLKAFSALLELFDVYGSKEKTKEKVAEISRLEGLMDQSQLTLMRQIDSLREKENNFSLLVIYNVLHNIEVVLDKLEEISNILLR
ncbi:MAG: hypothetical protein ACP6IP_10620 [Candidatus Njordarchaeia archaeon]